MLNSCGHALSQGDGSDFNPRGNWEATPPGYIACVRGWRRLAPHHGATPAWTYYGSPVNLEDYGTAGRCNWLWEESEMGCRGRLALGFKPRCSSHAGVFLGPCGLVREEPLNSISFSEIWYPGLGRGRRKDCAFVGILKNFGISMKTLSYYS